MQLGEAADETPEIRLDPLSALFHGFEQNKDGLKSRTVCVVLAEITHSSTGKATVD